MKLIFAVLSLAAWTFAAAAQAETPVVKPVTPAAAEQVEKVTLTNKIVDGKKTWLPADVKVKAGEKVELTLINTLPDPHGFTAPGLAKDVVVNGNETKVVTFTAPKDKGSVKFSCHLHPAHVGGTFEVQ